jgi:hypothetical protein
MKLEALCKTLREDAQKLREEKTKLEGMVESHDKLIMEITNEIGLNLMGEDVKDDEYDDDGGDATAPPAIVPSPVPMPPAAAHEATVIEEEDPMEMVLEQEAPVAHEVILQMRSLSCCSPASTTFS